MTAPPSRLARLARLAFAATTLALLALASPAQAAEQPTEAPADFHNGQSNGFGSVTMVPYLRVAGSSVPLTASFTITDLDAVSAAHDVLFAFNLKSDSAKVTLDSLQTASGTTLQPVSTTVVDGGRQPQVHVAPAALLAAAQDGRIDVVLRGRIQATANGQSHVGAMAIAFDDAWGKMPTTDGPAQLYGFTMLMATGVGGGGMPFQGQGNTWVVLPVALVAFVTAIAGTMAVRALAGAPPAPANLPPPPAPRAPVMVFGGPASPVLAHPAAPPRPVPARPAVPVAVAVTHVPVRAAPLQGPILPPHPLVRSTGAVPQSVASVAPVVPPPAASGKPVGPHGVSPVRTAVKRPKAAPAASGRPAATSSTRSTPRAAPARRASVGAATAGRRSKGQASR
jgi:hypothetical protein